MSSPLTLVTGASSGIGMHLAREFARNGHAVALVAPVQQELEELATRITSEFGVDALPIAIDLEQSESTERIAEHLAQAGRDVENLVNNAGHAWRGRFWEIPLERHLSVVRLNIEAVLRLTARFLPPMLERGHGRILNTASIAAYQPGPLLAVYHASKAFVLSWSEALAEELAERGITVTALCPGATDTDFFPKADMESTRAFQSGNVMAPQAVAEAGYAALMAGERVAVTGTINKALVFARRLLPETVRTKLNESQYIDVPPEQRTHKRGDYEGSELQ